MAYTILFEPSAKEDLKQIRDYIALDSKTAARNFIKQLQERISLLSDMPYLGRASIYHEDECFRDLIFKKYTIVYKVLENSVHILAIFTRKDY